MVLRIIPFCDFNFWGPSCNPGINSTCPDLHSAEHFPTGRPMHVVLWLIIIALGPTVIVCIFMTFLLRLLRIQDWVF